MPDFVIDRLFILESAQLFQGLSVDALTKVASITEEGRAKPNETIYRQGEPGDTMYIIVAGDVRLLKDGVTLMERQPGDSFGQVSLLDRGTRPLTAQARAEGADLLMLQRGPFMDMLFHEPDLVSGMFALLARRLRELIEINPGMTVQRTQSITRPRLGSTKLPLTAPSSSSGRG